MITNDDLYNITERCKKQGYDIKMGDISYLILCKHIKDKSVAYKCIFGTSISEDDVLKYEKSKRIDFLKDIINEYIKTQDVSKTIKNSDNITFEENREALINLLAEIKKAKKDGEIEPKDAYKMETDIRTKLNDKFNVADESTQRYVIVEPKFNTICEHTRKECWVQTKEFAKEHWHLYEKEEVVEELKKQYNLIEK